jgi:hypothetical protein
MTSSFRHHDGVLCVGAAYSASILGPYKDIGRPLVRNATMGNIDPTYFYLPQTKEHYLIWKEDANGAVTFSISHLNVFRTLILLVVRLYLD